MPTQVWRFAIFGKHEKDYTTSVRGPILLVPRRDGHLHPRLLLKEMADRDKIR